MAAILDSSFLIAYFNEADSHHQQAVKIMQKLKDGAFGKLFVTDYVFDEFVTFSAKRARSDLAIEWGQSVLDSTRIELMHTETMEFQTAWSLFKQYKKLSFTDCTILAVARHFEIDNVISFDSDFDGIKGVSRIS